MGAVVKMQSETMRPPNHRTHDLTPVTILVGPDKVPFTLYKEVLSFYSPYFRTAFEGSFREADDQKITLGDVAVSTFRHVARWLHTEGMEDIHIASIGTDNTSTRQDTANARSSDDTGHEERPLTFPASMVLTDIYIYADAYDIRLLRNHIMDLWRQEEIRVENVDGVIVSSHTFLKAIKSLPANASLYRYLLKRYATGFKWHNDANKQWLGDIADQLPSEFMYKFIIEQSKDSKKSKRPLYKDFYGWCKYHEHESQAEKEHCNELVARLRAEAENPIVKEG